jgi:LDH2 family malate/lactate/ureidoglycolate dehydrogenase
LLSGSGFGQASPGAPGNLLWALDVEAFLPQSEFQALIEQSRDGERAPGVDELPLPGERRERRLRQLTTRGVVPLPAASRQVLTAGCEALGVPL